MTSTDRCWEISCLSSLGTVVCKSDYLFICLNFLFVFCFCFFSSLYPGPGLNIRSSVSMQRFQCMSSVPFHITLLKITSLVCSVMGKLLLKELLYYFQCILHICSAFCPDCPSFLYSD